MFNHKTVLLEEAVKGLNMNPDGIYVDCTLGGAGHSEYILSNLSDKGRLYAFDQDDVAIGHAKEKLAPFGERFNLIKSNFLYLEEELKKVSGIKGAIFCHKGRFISIWETKEDALKALHAALSKCKDDALREKINILLAIHYDNS